MKGYALSIFNRGFIEVSVQEKKPFLGIFDLSFLFFSFVNISLSSYFLLNHGQGKWMFSFLEFSQVASYILVYILGRIIVENLLLNLFQITEQLSYFFISKRVYLCSISIGIFFLNLCCFYGFEKTKGDFELNLHFGGLSKNKENLDGISIGAFEMAQFCAGYHADKNPSITVLELPFLGVSSLEEERKISQAP